MEEWLSAFINTELETEFESHIPLEGLFCVKCWSVDYSLGSKKDHNPILVAD